MGRRSVIRCNPNKELKEDEFSREFGFVKRLFSSSHVNRILKSYDYPDRTSCRSWKNQSKRRKQYKY